MDISSWDIVKRDCLAVAIQYIHNMAVGNSDIHVFLYRKFEHLNSKQ